MLLFLCSRNIKEEIVIYSNLGESEKAIGTNLILHWNLKNSKKSHIEKKSTLDERLVNRIGKLIMSTCRGFCVIPRHTEISTSQFPGPMSHLQRVTNSSRNYETPLCGGIIRLLENSLNFMGLRSEVKFLIPL